jgi:PAS domain S-box-containing protein
MRGVFKFEVSADSRYELHTASRLNRLGMTADAKTLKASRFNIGPRLMLGFAVIIFSMLAADAVVLWQFHLVRAQAERLNGIDQKLVAVLRLHTSLTTFHDRLEDLADSQDIRGLVTEGEALRAAVLEDSRHAVSAFALSSFDFEQDPTILPILHAVQSALPAQLDAITTLAASGDWRAVHQRLANQVKPLESLTSDLVEKVGRTAAEQRAQTVQNLRRVERLAFVVVPLTALFTLLIAASFALAVTRSITQPLARLVEGSKALARGDFQHTVPVTGTDELAELGRVFNDTARRLQDLYATLQQSEDRLRLVIDTIPAHVWSARPDGSVDFINRRWLETTGLALEDALGWDWDSVVHPDDLARYVSEWRTALATGKPMESEVRLRRPGGEYRWWLTRNVPLRNEAGAIIKWYGTAIDIEDRKRAEEALRRSEAYLAEAQRLTHTGSWAWNLRTGELYWSQEVRRIYGLDPQAKPSWPWFFDRVHPEDLARVQQQSRMESTGKDWAVSEIEFRAVLVDGTLKHVHAISYRVTDASGETAEVIGTIVDVTERKRAEAERERLRQLEAALAHTNRVSMMGEFAASMAHDIKQPITAAVTDARTSLRWLQRTPPEMEEGRKAISRVVSAVNRAAGIIDHLRSLYEKGAPNERELVDVNEVAWEMLALLRSEANRHSIEMHTELAADLPKTKADRVQLQQVFMNLMLNGIEAMKDTGGELTVKSEPTEDEKLLISIKDAGVGLPTEQLDEIFSAFFTTKSQGTGMGLSISRTIIESHGGRLWASPNPGKGATFRFTLPTR